MKTRIKRSVAVAIAMCAVLSVLGCGDSGIASNAVAPGGNLGGPADAGWFSAWGTAIYTTYPNGPLTMGGISVSTGVFVGNEAVNQSFRMVIRPSTGGIRVRVRFSNAFGTQPLVLENVVIAQRAAPTGPAISANTPLTFAGARSIRIPVGEEVVSDGADFSFAAGQDLAVSFHAPEATGPMSWHSEAFSLQYASLPNSGDVTGDTSGLSFININRGWFFLSGLDVQADPATLLPGRATPPTIVIFGDSITDGFGSAIELNARFPDLFAQRLQAAGITAGVVNMGINSNTVLSNDEPLTRGLPGVQRFAGDVLSRSNLRTVFILLGTNDLSQSKPAEAVYEGLRLLADQARTKGVCVVVSTILPRADPPVPFGWDIATEEPERQKLNAMILASPVFDATVDLSSVMANPLLPNLPFQPYFVEGLHPNPIGYQVLANGIPLEILLPPPMGTCGR